MIRWGVSHKEFAEAVPERRWIRGEELGLTMTAEEYREHLEARMKALAEPETNPYSDVTTGTCGKCHKTPEEHYKDKQGQLWCVGNVNEMYEPIPIYYPAECKHGEWELE